jgi:hypothetical protein
MGIIQMLKDVFQLLGSMKPEYESVLHVLDLADGFVGCQQSASFWNSMQTFPVTINNGEPTDTVCLLAEIIAEALCQRSEKQPQNTCQGSFKVSLITTQKREAICSSQTLGLLPTIHKTQETEILTSSTMKSQYPENVRSESKIKRTGVSDTCG